MSRFHIYMLLFVVTLSSLTNGCSNPATTEAVTLPTLPPESPTERTGDTPMAPDSPKLILTSPAFKDGAEMANRYTYKLGSQCSGENFSPALEWTGVPASTQSLAITVVDPDGGNWTHWLLFNLSPETTSLSEAVNGPAIGIKGRNDFGTLGYGGPCPPSGTHHYIFTLYALDTTLSLQEGAKRKDFETAVKGHVLAQAQLTGLRTRR